MSPTYEVQQSWNGPLHMPCPVCDASVWVPVDSDRIVTCPECEADHTGVVSGFEVKS